MAKRKRINPRRQPTTKDDLKRERRITQDETIELCWSVIFSVLHDKFGFYGEQLNRMWNEVNKLSEEIAEKRVGVPDLKQVLADEEGIQIIDKGDRVCNSCRWHKVRHQKCACCRENPNLKTNYEEIDNDT